MWKYFKYSCVTSLVLQTLGQGHDMWHSWILLIIRTHVYFGLVVVKAEFEFWVWMWDRTINLIKISWFFYFGSTWFILFTINTITYQISWMDWGDSILGVLTYFLVKSRYSNMNQTISSGLIWMSMILKFKSCMHLKKELTPKAYRWRSFECCKTLDDIWLKVALKLYWLAWIC